MIKFSWTKLVQHCSSSRSELARNNFQETTFNDGHISSPESRENQRVFLPCMQGWKTGRFLDPLRPGAIFSRAGYARSVPSLTGQLITEASGRCAPHLRYKLNTLRSRILDQNIACLRYKTFLTHLQINIFQNIGTNYHFIYIVIAKCART